MELSEELFGMCHEHAKADDWLFRNCAAPPASRGWIRSTGLTGIKAAFIEVTHMPRN
jgi:hypothetical protein